MPPENEEGGLRRFRENGGGTLLHGPDGSFGYLNTDGPVRITRNGSFIEFTYESDHGLEWFRVPADELSLFILNSHHGDRRYIYAESQRPLDPTS